MHRGLVLALTSSRGPQAAARTSRYSIQLDGPAGRFEPKKQFQKGGLAGALRREALMARLKSELEVTCPCCQSTLVIDLEPRPRHLASRAGARRQARADRRAADPGRRSARGARRSSSSRSIRRRTRGDALSRRFEEALRQAHRSRSPSRRATSISTERASTIYVAMHGNARRCARSSTTEAQHEHGAPTVPG